MRRGFSLLEALLVVAVIGLMATVVIPVVQQSPDAAKKEKLEQDVVIVNNAIDAYLAAGGSQGALNAGGVIEALKQRVLGGVTAEMTGVMGPFLDPRVTTNASDFGWSARFESSPRPRFVVQNSSNGIVFGRGLPSPVGGPSSPSEPSWLWSYSPATALPMNNPVFEPGTVDFVTTTTNPPPVLPLDCPDISPETQNLQIGGFPLQVNLANPNPAGASIAYYRIGTTDAPDSGSWTLYVGSPFNVNPGSIVTAVAVSLDPSRYYNSTACSETYTVTPLQARCFGRCANRGDLRTGGGAHCGPGPVAADHREHQFGQRGRHPRALPEQRLHRHPLHARWLRSPDLGYRVAGPGSIFQRKLQSGAGKPWSICVGHEFADHNPGCRGGDEHGLVRNFGCG